MVVSLPSANCGSSVKRTSMVSLSLQSPSLTSSHAASKMPNTGLVISMLALFRLGSAIAPGGNIHVPVPTDGVADRLARLPHTDTSAPASAIGVSMKRTDTVSDVAHGPLPPAAMARKVPALGAVILLSPLAGFSKISPSGLDQFTLALISLAAMEVSKPHTESGAAMLICGSSKKVIVTEAVSEQPLPAFSTQMKVYEPSEGTVTKALGSSKSLKLTPRGAASQLPGTMSETASRVYSNPHAFASLPALAMGKRDWVRTILPERVQP